MFTLGHDFMPPSIHTRGLRYHEGLIKAIAMPQLATFDADVMFANAEGIIQTPEANHAICDAIDKALRCKATDEAKSILVNLTVHNHFNMGSYERYFTSELEDFDYPEAAIQHLAKPAKVLSEIGDSLHATSGFSLDTG